MTAETRPFEPESIDDLPAVIPIFPLTGALLLPRATLPLNIFEPRYLAMVTDSLAAGRVFGMIQPSGSTEGDAPPVYRTGCLGRVTAFQETEDGRILLTLKGLCRFHLTEELDVTTPYRQAQVNYTPFADDLKQPETPEILRETLLSVLENYFERTQMQVEWSCIEKAAPEKLVNYLSMICPFDSCEKQVLLEAGTVEERARLLIRFLELSGRDDESSPGRVQ